MKTFHTETAVLIGNLFKLERCGRYEDALAELQDIWDDTSKLPDVSEFSTPVAAEILLRCGVLIGFHGHLKQIPDSQENSKNLLTEARRQFETVNNLEKIAECNNYLALAYWRKGELVEAEAWVEETLSYDLNKISDVWIYCNIVKSLLLNSNEKYEESLIHLSPLESYVQKFGDSFLYGSFCANLGIALKDTGRTSEALKYLELARYWQNKSQHQIYLGTAENNLALLYKSVRLFDKAHKAIDNATKVFKKVKDLTREGFSFDTKAQIYFAESEMFASVSSLAIGAIGNSMPNVSSQLFIESVSNLLNSFANPNGKITRCNLLAISLLVEAVAGSGAT